MERVEICVNRCRFRTLGELRLVLEQRSKVSYGRLNRPRLPRKVVCFPALAHVTSLPALATRSINPARNIEKHFKSPLSTR